jgi:hypothetical protein
MYQNRLRNLFTPPPKSSGSLFFLWFLAICIFFLNWDILAFQFSEVKFSVLSIFVEKLFRQIRQNGCSIQNGGSKSDFMTNNFYIEYP